MLPREKLILKFYILKSPQVRQFNSLEVLFVRCADDYVLLLVVHSDAVDVCWICEISDAPLKMVWRVFPQKDWIATRRTHQIFVGIEGRRRWLSNFVNPF